MPRQLKPLDPGRSPEAKFGAELRSWRLKRNLNQPKLAAKVQVSPYLISKIELGLRRCQTDLAARLDGVLGTGGALTELLRKLPGQASKKLVNDAGEIDTATGQMDNQAIGAKTPAATAVQQDIIDPDPPIDGGEESVERRKFMLLAGAGAVAVSTPAGMLAALSPPPVPERITTAHIQQIGQTAQLFSSLDHAYGGALMRQAVTAQLHWSAQLLDSQCPPSLRPRLFSAVGALAATCGWMAFDDYAHADARTMLQFAQRCAEEAGDWHLRAKVLSHLGRQAIWCGDPDNGLTYIELALVRADRLTATEQAMLHTGRARALAKLVALGDPSRVEDALRAVGLADAAFAESDHAADPPWMAYYDEAQHLGDTGHALFDLVAAGLRDPRAARRLAAAVQGHSDKYARSRVISETKLATLIMMTGDPAEAVTTARSALRDAGGIRSRRAMTDLAELSTTAARHTHESGVPELRERIRRLTVQVTT